MSEVETTVENNEGTVNVVDGGESRVQPTPNPMELIMSELSELRKENRKLNKRLDDAFRAKKRLFKGRERSSIDPSCSVSLS